MAVLSAPMPERSFGRTMRYRRTRIGLSQAQLGELVGRSASSIRSWERDVSTPTDPSVVNALSAILDIDDRSLFDKAGVPTPVEETQPTMEEAFASLAPLPLKIRSRRKSMPTRSSPERPRAPRSQPDSTPTPSSRPRSRSTSGPHLTMCHMD